MREVYVKIDTEVINGTPENFIEFSEFWETHTNDNGYCLVYLDDDNKVVQ